MFHHQWFLNRKIQVLSHVGGPKLRVFHPSISVQVNCGQKFFLTYVIYKLPRVGSDPIFLDINPIRSNRSKVDIDPIRSNIWKSDLSPIQIRSRSSWYLFDPLRSNIPSYRSTSIQHIILQIHSNPDNFQNVMFFTCGKEFLIKKGKQVLLLLHQKLRNLMQKFWDFSKLKGKT